MQRPSADEYAPGYQKYVDFVPEGDYLSLLRQNLIDTITRVVSTAALAAPATPSARPNAATRRETGKLVFFIVKRSRTCKSNETGK